MHITIEQAAALLNSGQVVAVPTETVYGLAASLHHPAAIADIFALKGRPSNNPLIVHLADAYDIIGFAASLPPDYLKLADAFWPGPLTLVLPAVEALVPASARAGLPTVAFRIPNHPVTRALLAKTGPLVMPSANISGRPSATCAAHVETDFGAHFPVLDGGECQRGVESTILFWQESAWVVIRLGALSPDVFKPVLGYCPLVVDVKNNKQTPLCPGQLYRHYAPKARLVLARTFEADLRAVVIGFEDRTYPADCQCISLGVSTDPEIAAQRLYAVLRRLDQEGIEIAWVDVNVPDEGLWLTLKERLAKASLKI